MSGRPDEYNTYLLYGFGSSELRRPNFVRKIEHVARQIHKAYRVSGTPTIPTVSVEDLGPVRHDAKSRLDSNRWVWKAGKGTRLVVEEMGGC